ncbi:proton channel OTOP3-like [Parambassis ranga]|uniref:Proton channel OTOP3-like n=1 Tax=Parambassis ranga TaxID=210632 RepID=A0A6P7KDL4_9TELE|nr:proton channel OTOP3-like [Parambassis ranga]
MLNCKISEQTLNGKDELKSVYWKKNMDLDPISQVNSSSWGTHENPSSEEPVGNSDNQMQDPKLDLVVVWVPSGRRLISGLLGLNVVLLGAALVAGQTFNPEGLKHKEPQMFLLLLMGVSLVWTLWYVLWARKQSGICPHKDHHAGGVTVILVLMLFAAFSLLLFICRVGYLMSMRECKPAATVLFPFIEAPFLALQTYLLWAHSKDCIHRHKIITRSGLIVILSSDLLLWLNAVTEDTIHQEIELEKKDQLDFSNMNSSEADGSALTGNWTLCRCSASAACLAFRKGYEILYPFNIEYYLMAGCMIYVMWKNVGRRMNPDHHATQKLTLHIVFHGGIIYGIVLGVVVLLTGLAVFILYQVWVSQQEQRLTAFLIFYGYHLAVMPVMSLCSLAGMLIHRLERRVQEGGHNPTRSLDVILLVAAALGQLALSYFSLVAALAVGTQDTLGDLDLSYSLLSLLELILQNIFIIEGLHRHPNLLAKKKKRKHSSIFKPKKKLQTQEKRKADISLLEGNASAPPAIREHDGKKTWTKRAIQEICAFLILSNIMLWVIPAFGVHPQFENGLGKQFFGFTAWFVLVNLGQPLSVFYRMHSVGALMELLISA